MNTSRKSVLALALALSINAFAQDLSTEVIVERTIQPTERAASRFSGLSPSVVMPKAEVITLSTANYNGISPIDRSYTALNPADGAYLPLAEDYKGYVVLGYFPVCNVGLSAGYRILDSNKMSLNIWAQSCTEKYNPDDLGDMKYNGERVGVDFSTKVGQNSRLDAAMRYQYANSKLFTRSSQSYNSGDLTARWTSAGGFFDYNVGLGVGFDSYGDFTPFGFETVLQGLDQFRFEVDGGAAMALGEDQKAGLDLNFDYGHDVGVLQFTPYYNLGREKVRARVGIDLAVTMFDDSQLNFAPDVNLGWTPSSKFAVEASFTGGVFLNTMNHVREISPYLVGFTEYGRSRVPVDAELRVRYTPFAGFTAEAFGGYSVAKDWLMPDNQQTPFDPMTQIDIEGWHAGVGVNYSYKWLKVGASAETASSGDDKAYYLWRDRAKWVIGAFAEVNPIEKLKVGLNYEFRSDRHSVFTDLGDVNNLSLSASYDFTSAFSIFLQAENLLCQRYQYLPYIYSQKINGLIGFSFKF